MTAVSVTYILVAKEGFKLSTSIGYPVGIAAAVILFATYLVLMNLNRSKQKA